MNTKISFPAQLTPRELDVVRLLGGGCTYQQVAVRLGVSPHTVVTHIKNAYRKLDVHTAAAAVMRAVRLRLIEVDLGVDGC
jgi:DNA-binding CsgD family transcriptional regulator